MDPTASQSSFPPEYLAANNSAPLFITCIAFLIIETTFISLLYTSRFIGGDSKKANLSMLMLMTGCYIACLLSVKIGGAGRHMATLSTMEFTTALKLNTALQIVCPLTNSLSKLSILCLLHGVLASTSVRYKLVIRWTFIFVTIIAIVQLLIPFGNCRPFPRNWDVFGPGSCTIDGLALWKYMSIPNVLTTFFIVAVPVPALWRLKVTPLTKAGLAVVFGVCVAGVVAAIMRFLAFHRVQDFKDFTYEVIKPLSWTVAESGIYMVAGVLPTLRQLIKKAFAGVHFDKLLSGNKKWSTLDIKGEGEKTSEYEEKI
ncbi:hypothetical protein P280DRAFT_483075 [Massarina eburnea CBS 473.64]|uniref:Rhodopsin domain-containing protein n=1 Tax=Massarina eburnea CBS 473.64 TaxID=1395130 RepID=A0A6A6RPC9_9PLEO|nr:hypothetical protein P280DRAFT_483075 [Massarina eburnea CBS 473.64]